MIIPLLLIVVTSVWIMLACNPFEDAADYLGRNLGSGIKGATINAIGSSLPELFVTILSLFVFTDKAGFSTGIATSAGSAVFNAAVIPSVVIFAVLFGLKHKGIALEKAVIARDGIFYIVSVIAFIFLILQPQFSWWMGAILIAIYASYCGFLAYSHAGSDEEEEDDDDDEEEHSHNKLVAFLKFDYEMLFTGGKGFKTGTAWAALILATINIGAACYFLTESVIHLAEFWKINTFLVAVILAAAATSVPDTILSVKDAMKGNFEDAMSNAIGSNIFDICIGLGLPVTIYTLINGSLVVPTENVSGVLELIVILLGMTVGIIALFLVPKKVGVKTGIVLASGYLFYVAYVISIAKELPWAMGISSFITGIFGK